MDWGNSHQHMHMIGSSVNYDCCTAHLSDNAAQICAQIGANLSCDERLSFLRAKDEMKNNISAGLRHTLSPPLGAYTSDSPNQALRPGLRSCAALRLKTAPSPVRTRLVSESRIPFKPDWLAAEAIFVDSQPECSDAVTPVL
jgi:hypothetical protein